MTYVEKSHLVGRYDSAAAQGSERSSATHIAFAIVAWPLRVWRNRRGLKDFEGMSPELFRDTGLTSADVMAARYAPFHVGATIVLAELANQRRQSALQPSDDQAIDYLNASAKQETNP